MTDRNFPMGSPGLRDEVEKEVISFDKEAEEFRIEVCNEMTMLLKSVSAIIPVDPYLADRLLKFAADHLDHLIHDGIILKRVR